jgi:hypothetical protein
MSNKLNVLVIYNEIPDVIGKSYSFKIDADHELVDIMKKCNGFVINVNDQTETQDENVLFNALTNYDENPDYYITDDNHDLLRHKKVIHELSTITDAPQVDMKYDMVIVFSWHM